MTLTIPETELADRVIDAAERPETSLSDRDVLLEAAYSIDNHRARLLELDEQAEASAHLVAELKNEIDHTNGNTARLQAALQDTEARMYAIALLLKR